MMAYDPKKYKKKKIENLKKAIIQAHKDKEITDKQKKNLMDIVSGKIDPGLKKQKKKK